MGRPVLFVSDFGTRDPFVGVCHAVIARTAPGARVIDLTHGIPPGDVRAGALVLADAVPYAPPDAVYLAVVDPGVGTVRRPVAAAAGDAFLVGPDNGLLSLAGAALGGIAAAVEIASEEVVLRPTSETFHGRDVFAPAAAHLAAGAPLSELGPAVDPRTLVRVELPVPQVAPGRIRCQVVAVDRFGNVQLAAGPEDLRAAGLEGRPEVEVEVGEKELRVRRVRTFAEVPEGALGLLVDSSWQLALVRRGESAARALGLSAGDGVLLSSPLWDSAS